MGRAVSLRSLIGLEAGADFLNLCRILPTWPIALIAACCLVSVMAICFLATSGQSLASDNSREQLVIGVEELPPSPLPIGAPISTAMLYLHGFVGRSLTIYDPSWAV